MVMEPLEESSEEWKTGLRVMSPPPVPSFGYNAICKKCKTAADIRSDGRIFWLKRFRSPFADRVGKRPPHAGSTTFQIPVACILPQSCGTR
jgi:hypothetical protein